MCHSVIVSLALDKHVYRVTILDLHHCLSAAVAQEHRYAMVGSSSEGIHVANRTRCGLFERGL